MPSGLKILRYLNGLDLDPGTNGIVELSADCEGLHIVTESDVVNSKVMINVPVNGGYAPFGTCPPFDSRSITLYPGAKVQIAASTVGQSVHIWEWSK